MKTLNVAPSTSGCQLLKPLAIQGKQTLHNDIELANLQNILSQINDVIQLDVMLHLQVH